MRARPPQPPQARLACIEACGHGPGGCSVAESSVRSLGYATGAPRSTAGRAGERGREVKTVLRVSRGRGSRLGLYFWHAPRAQMANIWPS